MSVLSLRGRLRPVLVVLAACLSLALVAAGGTAAQAKTHRNDGRDARPAIDTRSVYLYPGFHREVVVQAYSRTYNAGRHFNGMDVYYDTRGNGGADYRLQWAFAKDGDHYTHFRLFRVRGTKIVGQVSCPGSSGKGRKKIRAIEIHVPRSCLGITKRVGVRTITWDYIKYRGGEPVRGYNDRAPNRGWVR